MKRTHLVEVAFSGTSTLQPSYMDTKKWALDPLVGIFCILDPLVGIFGWTLSWEMVCRALDPLVGIFCVSGPLVGIFCILDPLVGFL